MGVLSPALEVVLRRERGVLHLVSLYRPRGLLVAVGLLSVLASAAAVRCTSVRDSVRLECSRATDQCTVLERGGVIERIAVSGTLRCEARRIGKARDGWALVAVTNTADVSLLYGFRHELAAAADQLNRFLRDPSQLEWTVEDPRERVRTASVPILVVMNVVLIAALLFIARDKETVFDRARGVAVRRLTVVPSTRPLRAFRAVQVRALADDTRVRLVWSPEHERRRIVLVAHDESAWWVTLYQQPRGAPTDLDDAAAELAKYLGLPVEAPGAPLRASV